MDHGTGHNEPIINQNAIGAASAAAMNVFAHIEVDGFPAGMDWERGPILGHPTHDQYLTSAAFTAAADPLAAEAAALWLDVLLASPAAPDHLSAESIANMTTAMA